MSLNGSLKLFTEYALEPEEWKGRHSWDMGRYHAVLPRNRTGRTNENTQTLGWSGVLT